MGLGLALALSNCSRATKEGTTSSIRIQTPDSSAFSKSGISAYAQIPEGRKICYAVSVTAPDIPSTSPACSPPLGIFAGFVDKGDLELEVPRGENRQFDLYMYLMPLGDNSPCPKKADSLAGAQLRSTFHIGSAQNIQLANDHEKIVIPVSFPGISAHIGQKFSLPATCLSESPPNSRVGFTLSLAEGEAVGGSIRLKARIGKPMPAQTATGGSYRLNGSVE